MASTSKIKDSHTAMELGSNNIRNALMPSKDQCYLLYFIFGTYFGPNLKGEECHKSVLQRKSESLPPYDSDQLGSSHMETIELKRIYYYVLLKANKSLVVKSSMLDQFFKGNLPTPTADIYPQFPDLFPLELHSHSKSTNGYDMVENIVFIHNPEIAYIRIQDIAKFARLAGREDFFLDRDAARLHSCFDSGDLYDVTMEEARPTGGSSHIGYSLGSHKKRAVQDKRCNDQQFHIPPPIRSTSSTDAARTYKAPVLTKDKSHSATKDGAAMIFFPSPPSNEELANLAAATKSGTALTGSAAMGQIGPILGRMDIAESEDSYLFRVSLPGVKRDESEFSCEVEDDGKVLIRGVTTTGEKKVHRFSQTFEMLSQNLCPPGHFSISFQLPGPVDPQQFSGKFGTDGILEGMVMKKTPTSTSCLVCNLTS